MRLCLSLLSFVFFNRLIVSSINTGVSYPVQFTFQVPEIRVLTGEEQKEVCKTATLTASRQFDFDRTLSRCYVGDQVILDSVIAPGKYDVKGISVINFDGSGETAIDARVIESAV